VMSPGSALSHPPRSTMPATQRKGGLGRGLAALIPTAPVGAVSVDPVAGGPVASDSISRQGLHGDPEALPGQVVGAVYQEVPIAAIVPNPRQPRQVFDDEALAE